MAFLEEHGMKDQATNQILSQNQKTQYNANKSFKFQFAHKTS